MTERRDVALSDVAHSTGGRRRAEVLARMPGAGRSAPLVLGSEMVPWPRRARVLVIRPDHLGDVLLAGPALAQLREARPNDEIRLLVGPWSREIARGLHGPNAVEIFPFPSFARSIDRRIPGSGYVDMLRLARLIRRGRWDAAFVLRDDDYVSAWAAALAGVPLRIGHSEPSVTPFLTHALPAKSRPAHVTAAGIALARAAAYGLDALAAGDEHTDITGADPIHHPLDFRLDEAAGQAAERLLGQLAGSQPIAIHPGAGADIKRWSAPRWATVVRSLCAPGEAVILTGSAVEQSLSAAIARILAEDGQHPTDGGHAVLDLAGKTSIGTLAAVYARCRLVLGPDSGPLHLASAVGTPSVHIFGPADPARFGPWGDPERHRVVMSDLPCAPCGRLDWPDPGGASMRPIGAFQGRDRGGRGLRAAWANPIIKRSERAGEHRFRSRSRPGGHPDPLPWRATIGAPRREALRPHIDRRWNRRAFPDRQLRALGLGGCRARDL